MTDLPIHVGDVPASLLALAREGKIGGANDTLKKHRVLNRLAIVQSGSKKLRKKYEEGDLVIPGADTLVMHREGSFNFVPVMYYDEYVTWWDRNDKAQESAMKASTLDHNHEIAIKASDRNRRAEVYDKIGGKDLILNHTHHMNFLILITSGPLAGQLCAMSFARGEWTTGRQFINAIQMRKIPTSEGFVEAPLWSTQWVCSLGQRTKDEYDWFGFDISPADEPWTPENMMVQCQKFHEELKADYLSKAISVDHESGLDSAFDEEVVVDDGEM